MKKKVIGLSTLLLVLLLGLFTTCYADNIRDWDELMIKNLIYNYSRNVNSLTDAQAKEVVSNATTYINTCLDYVNDYEVVMFYFSGYDIACSYSNSGGKVYLYENRMSSTDSQTWNTIMFNMYHYTIEERVRLFDTYSINTNWGVFDKNVFQSSNSNTLIYPAGTVIPNVNILEDPYINDFFSFNYNSNLDLYELKDDISPLGMQAVLFSPGNESQYFGYLEQSEHLRQITKSKYYWDKYKHLFEIYSAENINFTSSDDRVVVNIVPNDNANILIRYDFWPVDEEQFEILSAYYIVTDSKTSFSGDYIDLTATFDDDNYYNNYINNINDIKDNEDAQQRTDEIINTITDDSEVDNIISTMPTSSGDVANAFGYLPIENPFTTFLLNLVQRFYTTLTTRNKEYLNLNHHGSTTWTVDTDKFITPDGTIKTLIRTLLVFLWIFGNYKYFHYLITLLQTARIDKAITELGTDEFYDSDIM